VLAQGDVRTTYQRKVNAGATQLENRVPLRRSLTGPPALATNIAIPTFEAGRQAVYLLPDRLLVRDGRRYADISYATVSSDSKTIVFIEDGHAPNDSAVVGTTWRFVNKSGGPDRRFKDNRQLPKLAYGEFNLGSSGGLQQVWQFSRPEAAAIMVEALSSVRDPLPQAPVTSAAEGGSV
jgi:DNA polymerase-3 subunit epsilon